MRKLEIRKPRPCHPPYNFLRAVEAGVFVGILAALFVFFGKHSVFVQERHDKAAARFQYPVCLSESFRHVVQEAVHRHHEYKVEAGIWVREFLRNTLYHLDAPATGNFGKIFQRFQSVTDAERCGEPARANADFHAFFKRRQHKADGRKFGLEQVGVPVEPAIVISGL